ncbi:GIN domain-containing protein [Caulobacter henricii]|uniref:Putative auto-transporter adhesin head GIN domain-containing protein n=1 Tax=Caulobacter henricii TaxID=69395 RepID=A0A0P0NYL6_9CAUL|nr:DUF2807 domain-containing protein [Caulobacter henricii]ALL12975.1 hypothetical protein AQ619_06210 [Caulobacter henricii]
MRALLVLAAGAAALGFAGAASAAPSVRIKDAVARVVVIPEARTDIKVEFLTTNKSLPLTIRQNGADVTVDGDLRLNRIHACNTAMGRTTVKVRGVGEVNWDDFPQIVIRTPMQAEVSASGAVFGSIGRSDRLELANAGCGDWVVANVKGGLEVSQAGSGDTSTGTAGSAEINIAGSGNVRTQEVAGDFTVAIAGSGNAGAASVGGKVDISIAGSGDVSISGGRATSIDVSIMGSGDVNHDGEVGDVDVSVAGSGDVRIARATGRVSKSVAGSGDVFIGH